jgi:uncharacterized protein YqhQ
MNVFLEQKIPSRVRRNHGLEHATIHVLGKKYPWVGTAGLSDAGGFWIIGNLELDAVTDSAVEALERLRAGEKGLAYHPNCGTNFAATGVIAGFFAWLSMLGVKNNWKAKLDRLPQVMTMTTLAIVLAQPLGAKLQISVTTSPDMGNLELTGITVYERAGYRAYRITTKG